MAVTDAAAIPGKPGELPYAPLGPTPARSEQVTILFQAWRTLIRHKWVIAGVTLAGILFGLVATLLIPETYQAKVRIEIDPTANSDVDVGEVSRRDRADAMLDQTAVGLLQARSLSERVARNLNLANDPQLFDQSLPRSVRMRNATNMVAGNLSVEQQRLSRLIDVYYSANDPEFAAKVANSVAENFIQSKLDRGYEQTAFARDFLQERLDSTRRRLEDSERALVEFERNQGIVTVQQRGADGSVVSQSISSAQLSDLATALAEAQRKRIAAEQRFRQGSKLGNASGDTSNQALQTEIAQIRAKIAEMSQTFSDDYPEIAALRRRLQVLESELGTSNNKGVDQLGAAYRAAQGEEAEIRNRLNALRDSVLSERGASAQYTVLSREVDTNRELYDALLQRLKEVGVAGEVTETDVSIVDRASVPTSPISPNLILNLALGLIGGLFVGFAGAFAFDLLRDVIRSPSDLEERLGLKALGYIPLNEDVDSVPQALVDPKSPITEAYFSVANLLGFATAEGLPKHLVVTSTMPEEGKSSSSYGLAISCARQGKSVLLVDADLRRPTFKLPKKSRVNKGFMHLLTGQATVDETILHGESGISYITAGGTPPNPSELFSSGRVRQIFDDLAGKFDIVIFDAPPIANFVDAPILASVADGTLIVFEANRIHTNLAAQSVTKLMKFGAYVVGGLVTKYDHRKDDYTYYTYGYNYDYSSRSDSDTTASERTITIVQTPQ
ncbi:MAG: polysaccharide biosynthesis tyrosine autokinase [Blastomonas sp.]